MLIIGCDYHPSFQQIAFVDTESGELEERRLVHVEEAEQFYDELKQRNVAVRVGMEASGHARWFERLLRQLEFELWIGDAAEIRAKRVRKQKTDRQDAQLLLRLLTEDRFPRIWVPDAENRDLRQLLWHRHRLVQMRARVMNQLHVVALNEGLQRKKALWRPAGRKELESLALAPWASRRLSGSVGVTRPTHAADPEVGASTRSGSGEASGGAAADDAPRSGAADGIGFRVSDRNSGPFSLRETDRQLCGAGSRGKLQRRSATIGAHQQASKATCYFVFCWWKRRRRRYEINRNGAVTSSTSPCDVGGRSPRLPWRASWRCICTGCGVRDGTMASSNVSVRTRERPEIAMAENKSPT
jgi:hypothetical protein